MASFSSTRSTATCAPTATAVSPVTAARYRLPFLDRLVRVPDWLSSGVRPAQEAKWVPEGNRLMSGRSRPGRPGRCAGPSRASTRSGRAVLRRAEQQLDHLGQRGDLGGQPVDALQHHRQQRGVVARRRTPRRNPVERPACGQPVGGGRCPPIGSWRARRADPSGSVIFDPLNGRFPGSAGLTKALVERLDT